MESWVVGYEGDDDVERHAGTVQEDAAESSVQPAPLRIRAVSDYI
jgi:hypothetical protein